MAFWENLKDSLSHPDTLMMDFESASINAETEAFLNTEVVGCLFFFHFYQSLYRKVVELGISVTYREDKNLNFSLSIRMFAALGVFAPPPNILNLG